MSMSCSLKSCLSSLFRVIKRTSLQLHLYILYIDTICILLGLHPDSHTNKCASLIYYWSCCYLRYILATRILFSSAILIDCRPILNNQMNDFCWFFDRSFQHYHFGFIAEKDYHSWSDINDFFLIVSIVATCSDTNRRTTAAAAVKLTCMRQI